jgi:NTE family protein
VSQINFVDRPVAGPATLMSSRRRRRRTDDHDDHSRPSGKVYNVIQLIYHSKQYEGASKDFDFSRRRMRDHRRARYQDTVRTLRHPETLQRPGAPGGVLTFDLARDGRE